jgi:aspartate 1-decarboxylase
MISLNGSAERRAQLGDQVIIAVFAMVNETELAGDGAQSWYSLTIRTR